VTFPVHSNIERMFLRRIFSLLCGLALLLEGCAPLVLTVGAGTSYAANRARSRSTVEIFFDDLGRSIQQTTRRLTGTGGRPRKTTSTSKSRNGLALKILQCSLAPSKVHPGDQVKVVLQYSIAGAPTAGVELVEKNSLMQGGKVLTVLKDERSTKESGTWENTLSFAVPQSAKPGEYTVKLQVSSKGTRRTVQRSFSVIQ